MTDEIIKNSLVRQNGRFNFEALANLNDIIERKKVIKKKYGLDAMVPHKTPSNSGNDQHAMVIKSYSETGDASF